jgi:hypothetical protein
VTQFFFVPHLPPHYISFQPVCTCTSSKTQKEVFQIPIPILFPGIWPELMVKTANMIHLHQNMQAAAPATIFALRPHPSARNMTTPAQSTPTERQYPSCFAATCPPERADDCFVKVYRHAEVSKFGNGLNFRGNETYDEYSTARLRRLCRAIWFLNCFSTEVQTSAAAHCLDLDCSMDSVLTIQKLRESVTGPAGPNVDRWNVHGNLVESVECLFFCMHLFRVSRLGYIRSKGPEFTESILRRFEASTLFQAHHCSLSFCGINYTNMGGDSSLKSTLRHPWSLACAH